jgi:hypothetical protein
MPVTPDPEVVLAKDLPPEPIVPAFGPGSRQRWDNPKNAPFLRKHVGIDPDGTRNQKLL